VDSLNSVTTTNDPGLTSNSVSVPSTGTSVPETPVSSDATSVDYDVPSGVISILLSDGNSSCSGEGVSIDNATNEIVISALGSYYLKGSLSNGNIRITAEESSDDTVTLYLNGVYIAKDMTNNVYGPIYSVNSSKLTINRIAGSTSIIEDKRPSANSGSVDDDTAAIFSNKKLKLTGTGALKVTSTFNNGLASDTHIRIKEGSLDVTAVNHALKAHKSIILGQSGSTGSFYLTSNGSDGDGIRVDEVDEDVTSPTYGNAESDDDVAGIEIKDGYYEIKSAGKCISSEAYTYMEGGNGTITSSADKGIKAELDVYLDGGNFVVTTLKDDCVHSSTNNLYANGGSYTLSSGTSDSCQGLKAEEEVVINGGFYLVKSSNEGIAAHKITANGGTSIVYSSDDGWSAGGTNSQSSSNCVITISGGYHYVYASGDGLDSNGNIIVTGGTTIVSAPNSGGNGPLDYGDGGSYYMSQSGGILVAYGVSGMAVGATTGDQGSVLLSSHSSVTQNSYLVFQAGDSAYAVKLTRAATTTYASFPEFVSNGSYAIGYVSSISDGTSLFDEAGLYSLTSYPSSATSLASGTFSSLHVSSGSSSGPGGGGNPGGGGGHGGGR
jgi:hypothetical protein